jgi:5-methylcytosine-specific restriction protein A
MTGRWSTSTRRASLPRDWSTRRRARRAIAADRCEAETHATGCDGLGRECHHAGDPDDHRIASLRWLHPACHQVETQEQAAAARAALRRRPTEPTAADQLAARRLAAVADVVLAAGVGGGPLPRPVGTGGDSSSLRIQVRSLRPPHGPCPACRGAGSHEPWCPGGEQ